FRTTLNPPDVRLNQQGWNQTPFAYGTQRRSSSRLVFVMKCPWLIWPSCSVSVKLLKVLIGIMSSFFIPGEEPSVLGSDSREGGLILVLVTTSDRSRQLILDDVRDRHGNLRIFGGMQQQADIFQNHRKWEGNRLVFCLGDHRADDSMSTGIKNCFCNDVHKFIGI